MAIGAVSTRALFREWFKAQNERHDAIRGGVWSGMGNWRFRKNTDDMPRSNLTGSNLTGYIYIYIYSVYFFFFFFLAFLLL
jgi:GTPase involved in cell partitioning and DNA repair